MSELRRIVETEKFNDILQKIRGRKNVILHCSGVPGSGTSNIVRELRKRFPFAPEDKETTKKLIIRHIRCKDQGHDVKEELKQLTDELRKDSSFIDYETYQEIIAQLDDSVTDTLVKVLLHANAPALLIVEDPTSDKNKKSNKLLQDLLRNLNKNAKQSHDKFPKHLYISSRFETAILDNQEINDMDIYVKETVTGFTKTEALEYLKLHGKLSQVDKIAAEKIYDRFNGLPLGLQVARSYCIDAKIGYETYLDLFKNLKMVISFQEKKEIIKEFGESVENMFQAIVMPFIPRPESGNTPFYWMILSCLAYFSFYRIPRSAIDYCSHVLREKKVSMSQNTADVGNMISKLLGHDMCNETREKEIIFHEVVNNSFRLIQQTVFKMPFNPIEKAIEVMSGLVTKDMRRNVQSEKMYKLRRHLQTLLSHIEKNEEELFGNERDCFMLKALTSHLYETAATIMLNESAAMFLDESNKYFEKALKLFSGDDHNLISNSKPSDYKTVAKEIVARSKNIGQTLPEDFTIEYASKLMLDFDQNEVAFLQSKCREMGYEEVENFCDTSLEKIFVLRELQSRKLFLSNDEYAPVFYAERVASILHSHSRLVLYANLNEARQNDKWMWMTKLSNSIAIECRTSCGVSLLTERLSQTWGIIPIVLKLEKTSYTENQEVLKLCKDALSKEKENIDVYENGLLKKDFGPCKTSPRISLLKSITRINARQVRLNKNQTDFDAADRYCQELLDLAYANALNMSSGTMSIIYCAKYYAARNNFQRCMSCFTEFFKIIENEKLNLRFNVRCWAVYNYAKGVNFFNAKAESHFKTAISKCKQVLNDNELMSKDINDKLKSCLEELEKLQTGASKSNSD